MDREDPHAKLYEEWKAALLEAGYDNGVVMSLSGFERWIAQGPMKGDGERYLERGRWPRFRDISDLGRIQIVSQAEEDAHPLVTMEVRPEGFYWFTVGLARAHYRAVADVDFLLMSTTNRHR